MARNIIALISFLTVLVACAAPQTTIPTRMPITPSQTPFLPTEVVLSIGDGGLLTGQPCASPCFFGIRIGETSLNQIVSKLESNGISSCTRDTDGISCGFAVFIGVHSSTLIVNSIGYLPSVPVSIGNVIEKYGNPDLLQVFPGDIPEYSHISILLFWDSIHMRIHLPEIDGETYVIEKNTYIELVTFFDETQYADLRKNAFSRPWQGYGTYQLDPSQ